MPRTARASVGGFCSHVISRGNARAEVFRKPEESATFRELLPKGADGVLMRVLASCVMPNHCISLSGLGVSVIVASSCHGC